MADPGGYKPIADYAVIGNLRSAALVCRDGSIDWCCFPQLDSPSVFAALLDAKRGGRFAVRPVNGERGGQRYVGDSNVLATRFDQPGSRLTVTDFMPLRGDLRRRGGTEAASAIHRVLECEGAAMDVEIEWSPRFDYARGETRLERVEGGWLASGGGLELSLGGVEEARVAEDGHGATLLARLRLRPGDRRAVVTRWGSRRTDCDPDASLRVMNATRQAWEAWARQDGLVDKRGWAGQWQALVTRSALLFKLLTHADTGAIAAAPTTSLPEHVGGVRNWDYRYAWLRDSSMIAQAMTAIGHEEEAIDLLEWFEEVSKGRLDKGLRLQIMCGLRGEAELDEFELPHLEGYRGSRPVNIGNGAATQFQLETYGELLQTAYELARRGHRLKPDVQEFLRRVADHVVEAWERPDHGIWEMRCEPRHFVYSKAMAWAALDRAAILSERHAFPGDAAAWREARKSIRDQVLRDGVARDLGGFAQSYGSLELDAANLRLPILELLPASDPRIQRTIDLVLERLTHDGLVYRYLAEDGLPGKEGAFGLCSFWLVDALALSGRIDEAGRIFEQMAGRANHVGLFPEQFDPFTGEFLGNFPQAFTHIGLINSALYLAWAEGREAPEHAPLGTPEHRNALRESGPDRAGTRAPSRRD